MRARDDGETEPLGQLLDALLSHAHSTLPAARDLLAEDDVLRDAQDRDEHEVWWTNADATCDRVRRSIDRHRLAVIRISPSSGVTRP